jgi:restriction system protein
MERTKPKRHRATARRPLFDNGIAALAFALVCLLAPVLLERSGESSFVAEMLRVPAAVGLALGTVLLALHWSARRNPRTAAHAPVDRHGPTEWGMAVFDQMDASGFEALCERLFAQAGFATRAMPRGDGAALDICLYSRHARGPVAMVRCRHTADRPIGVDELRELHANMLSRGIARGTYATGASFTPEAAPFAREHGINTLDRARLLALIANRSREQQQDLLAAALGPR